MSEPVLQVQGLTSGYGGVAVIRDVTASADRGKVTAIVGPNGAGKSTLIKTLAGVVRPMGGSVILDGTSVGGLSADALVRRRLSYVPQVRNIFPSLTVMENLEMGGYVRRSGVRKKAAELCDLFPDLGPARKRQAQTLSGGQRNMLAMARGLMSDPLVLLVDEPTAGLSPKYEGVVWEHIEQIRKAGVAVLVVEQNTRRALSYADWAYVLVLGEVQLQGPGKELLDNDVVADLYIGRASHRAGQDEAVEAHRS